MRSWSRAEDSFTVGANESRAHTDLFVPREGVEGLAVVLGLISLISGGAITQLIGMGIAIGIIVVLTKPEERAWFTR
ncbi:hypothetical protein GCM10027598_48970 [Amycolatopsis oliviviridis]|uniref:Uncharacterized protein n=1 Tax=Amycolatopsis oliviviridis TaxID=1471590 RepID=A0ABQ3M0V0_9PSEU|nr:hypothetical protein GCM10017790_65460 [Amycolatopsis oliviviridis]